MRVELDFVMGMPSASAFAESRKRIRGRGYRDLPTGCVAQPIENQCYSCLIKILRESNDQNRRRVY